MIPVPHLDKKRYDILSTLIEEVSLICTDNLVSIYLYGSAAGKGYDQEKSNLNTLIVLKKIEIGTLTGIAGIYKKRAKLKIVAPLILTHDYIRSSTDVFPIEFLDIKENSIMLTGEDILNNISIDFSSLRGQCEREIKGQLVRFRGSFLEVEGDRKGMEKLVIAAISSLIFPLKNILRISGREVPGDSEALIKDCCKAMNVSDISFLEAWEMKKEEQQVSLDNLYNVISGYMSTVEEISNKIDAMKDEGRV